MLKLFCLNIMRLNSRSTIPVLSCHYSITEHLYIAFITSTNTTHHILNSVYLQPVKVDQKKPFSYCAPEPFVPNGSYIMCL